MVALLSILRSLATPRLTSSALFVASGIALLGLAGSAVAETGQVQASGAQALVSLFLWATSFIALSVAARCKAHELWHANLAARNHECSSTGKAVARHARCRPYWVRSGAVLCITFASGVLLLSLLQPRTLYADEPPPPPNQPLSEEELLERTVFTSDGIVIAAVDSVYEVTRPFEPPPIRWVAIRPKQWVKGKDSRAQVTFWVPRGEGSPLLPPGKQPLSSRRPYLIFLKSTASEWYLNSAPGIWNGGVVALSGDAEKRRYVGRVERMLDAQTLDSLTTSADLVVLGTPAPEPRSFRFGARGRVADAYFRVDRVIAGGTADSILAVTTPYFIDVLGSTQRLLFLKRAPDGTYEVVKAGAGSLSLKGHSVQRLGLDIDSVAKRAHQLKPGRPPEGGAR